MFRPSDDLIQAMNEQIGHEMAASMQYVAIAGYFTCEALPELARFFDRQADEERQHAMKFVHFLLELRAPLDIPAIPAPRCEFDSPEDAVGLALGSEETVTRQIDGLFEMAEREGHTLSESFLEWFVNEQLEEVNTMRDLLQMVRRAGSSGILFVEEYLARTGGPAAGSQD